MRQKNCVVSHNIALILCFIAVGIVALYLIRPISDPDFFWHLKTGQWILQHNSLPATDPFSISPPPADSLRARFILTSYWLAQIIYAALYAMSGWWGILIVRVALVGIMAALFAARCNLLRPVNVCLLLLVAIQVLEVYPLERPQVFSFVCFTALLVLLDRYRSQKGEDARIVFFAGIAAALMLLWANMHGGFIVGLVTLTLFLIMEGVKFSHPSLSPLSRQRYGGLVIIILSAMAASFLNANPINSIRALLDVGETNNIIFANNIEYFSSLRILTNYKDYTVILNWLMIAVAALCALTSLRRPDITWLALVSGTAFMGCQHVRYMPFFLVAALLFVGKSIDSGDIGYFLKTILTVATLGAVYFFAIDEVQLVRPLIQGKWGVDHVFPIKAADFAVRQNLKGPVFNTYLWGGYLIWRLGPEQKIFCDNRQLDALRYWEWMNSKTVDMATEPYWKGMIRKYGIQTVIVQLIDPSSGQMDPLAASLRMDKEWSMVFAQENAAVFIRKDNLQ